MQQLQHKRFTMSNRQSALPISYSYVPAHKGFIAMGNVCDNEKVRPWFER